MLLGNGIYLNANAGRLFGGGNAPISQGNYLKSGARRNVALPDGGTAALPLIGYPSGYSGGSAYFMPLQAGEITSYGEITGTGTTGSVNLAGGLNGEAPLTGSGTITNAEADLLLFAVATLLGSGAITNAAGIPVGVLGAALAGSGDIDDANMAAAAIIVANLSGSGTITGANGILVSTLSAAANLSGSGAITAAVANAIAVCNAALTGDGDITNAAGVNTVPAVAALTGTGTVSAATIRGLGWMAALPGGAGTISAATLNALGTLQAAILSYGELTPEGIRDKVWQAIAADYNDSGTMGQKLNSASAGGVDLDAMAAAVWAYVSRTLTTGGGGATAAEIWSYTARTLTASSDPTAEAIASAIMAALNATEIPVDVKKVNSVAISGTGVAPTYANQPLPLDPGDPWRPA